jgi:phosphate-selective porin OprO/OprP
VTFILFLSAWFLLSDSAHVRAGELPGVDERILRIQSEIRTLQESNRKLEQEIGALKGDLHAGEALPLFVRGEGEVEAVCPAGSPEELGLDLGARYDENFCLRSSALPYSLHFGGKLTGRLSAFDSGYPLDDAVSIKRARLETEASLLDYFVRMEAEFAEPVKLKDGYLEFRHFPDARLRLGQFIVPFGLEVMQAQNYTDFADVTIASRNMVFGARDIGAMLYGRYGGDLIGYRFAVLNGAGENQGDNNDSKDIAARLVFRPFAAIPSEYVSFMCLGLASTHGDQNTDFSNIAFRTVGRTEFVDFAEGAIHRGTRTRLGEEFVWPVGPASIKAELMQMWLDDFGVDSVEEDLFFYSWYLSGSYLLTGEHKCWKKIVPNRPFNPSAGGWGAWEIAARYSIFDSEEDLFELGMASGAPRAEAFTIGLNWHLNEFVRMFFNYERTEFNRDVIVRGKPEDCEGVFIVQWQIEF